MSIRTDFVTANVYKYMQGPSRGRISKERETRPATMPFAKRADGHRVSNFNIYCIVSYFAT